VKFEGEGEFGKNEKVVWDQMSKGLKCWFYWIDIRKQLKYFKEVIEITTAMV
jgi:hypothetical protein